jgi:replicative DNA helicase
MGEPDLRVIEGGRGDDDLGKPPPHDLDVEGSVVGNALYQGDLMPDLVQFVSATDFYSEAHRRIFEAAERLLAAGKPVDPVTVATDLRQHERIEQVGGMAYIIGLVQQMPVMLKHHVLEHARRVRELRVRRDLIGAGRMLTARGLHDAVDTATLAVQAAEAIEGLGASLGGIEDEHRVRIVAARMMQGLENAARKVTTGKARRWGWAPVDERTAGLHATLAVVGGRPGMGKTSFGCAAAVMSSEQGYGCPLFSLETPREELLLRMTCARARLEVHRARVGALTSEEWARFTGAAAELAELPLWIDDTKGILVREIWSRVRRIQLAAAREGRELGPVVIDYLQLLGPPRKGMDREEAIAENCRALLAMAGELGVPVIALAQLKPEVDKRTDKRPDLADFRGSGEIVIAARTILLLYRADYYGKKKRGYHPTGEVEVNIAKQNNGPTGVVSLHFEEKFGVFSESVFDGAPAPAAATYVCGGCGCRVEAGRSCACGKTTTPPIVDDEAERDEALDEWMARQPRGGA